MIAKRVIKIKDIRVSMNLGISTLLKFTVEGVAHTDGVGGGELVTVEGDFHCSGFTY